MRHARTKLLSFSVSAAVAAGLAGAPGCTTSNPASVKSSAGKDVEVASGQSAQQQADRLSAVRGGPAVGKRSAELETVALFQDKAMPTGVTVSRAGRIFLSFPRWNDPVKHTAVELRDGQLVPFPDAATNAFDATKPDDPAARLVSVQSVVVDEQDRLWLLDPGSFNFAPVLNGGPKLWGYDLASGKRVKAIAFPNDVAMKMSYLNDVRFDLKRGKEGTAYITDSGAGGMVVVDLASGESWRHLDRHESVMPTPFLQPTTEGEPFLQRKPTGEVAAPDVRSDGIALSPDGATLYYTPLMSRDVYAVPTDLLADPDADGQKVAAAVRKVATKPSANDGLICDGAGRVYSTDWEDNAIRRIDPESGEVTVVVQDERLTWPDTLAMHDGYLYVANNQLARQPNYHFGKDQRKPPYALFRVRVDETVVDGPPGEGR